MSMLPLVPQVTPFPISNVTFRPQVVTNQEFSDSPVFLISVVPYNVLLPATTPLPVLLSS